MTNNFKDYYDILQVHRNADDEIIEKAYKTLVKKHHPDHNLDNIEYANHKMAEISEAYKILKDPDKRYHYNIIYDSYNKNIYNSNPLSEVDNEFQHTNDNTDTYTYDNSTYNTKPRTPHSNNSTTNNKMSTQVSKGWIIAIACTVLVLVITVFVFTSKSKKTPTPPDIDTKKLEQLDKNSTIDINEDTPDTTKKEDTEEQLPDKIKIDMVKWKSLNPLVKSNGYNNFSSLFTDQLQILGQINTSKEITRAEATKSSKETSVVKNDQVFYVFGMLNNWYDIHIKNDDFVGYTFINASNVTLYVFDNSTNNFHPISTDNLRYLKSGKLNSLSQLIKKEDKENNQPTDNNNDNNNNNDTDSNTTKNNNSKDNYYFTLYSSKDDVLNAMHEPTNQENKNNQEIWYYGSSSITFYDNKVVGWNNKEGNINVTVGNKQNNAQPFNTDSTINDVIASMGTPDVIELDGNHSTWYYSNSYIDFENNTVIGWDNASNNLNVIE